MGCVCVCVCSYACIVLYSMFIYVCIVLYVLYILDVWHVYLDVCSSKYSIANSLA